MTHDHEHVTDPRRMRAVGDTLACGIRRRYQEVGGDGARFR